VRITDPAIIAAATLSDRYIADRFLPDKAIDLIDEAAARQRMQVDSKPEELDEFDRRIMQLKIEQEALKKETDTASKDPSSSPATYGTAGESDALTALEGREGQAVRPPAQGRTRRRAQRTRLGAAQALRRSRRIARHDSELEKLGAGTRATACWSTRR
jgi:ATP-dependent Clp protease ATP-binding subunit ClpB